MLQVPLRSQQEPRASAQGFGLHAANIVHWPSHRRFDDVTAQEPVVEQQAPDGCKQSVVVQASSSPL
jgi:hypothetical protein